MKTPINHFTEVEDLGNGQKKMTLLSYPKYYDNGGQWDLVDTAIQPSTDTGWNYEVKKGVYKLRIKVDGTFEFAYKGDILSKKILGVGFYNTDTKERIIKTNLILSTPTVSGNEISWSLPLGCIYKVVYYHDTLKDIFILSEQAKTYLKNNKPVGWNAENTYFGIIYDLDLSQTALSTSADIESSDDIKFVKDGKWQYRFRRGYARLDTYDETKSGEENAGKAWLKLKAYKNGKYTEIISAEALTSSGEIILNDTLNLTTSSKDIYLDSNNDWPHTGYELNVSGESNRSLVAFDLSGLPAGCTVTDASLGVYATYTDNGGNQAVNAYRVWKEWVEVSDWSQWDHDNSKEWGTAGCNSTNDSGSYNTTDGGGDDRKATEDDGFASTSTGWWTWEGSSMAATVQSNFDNSKYEGWVLIKPTAGYGINFASKENADEAKRPKLNITYTSGQPPVVTGIMTTNTKFWGAL